MFPSFWGHLPGTGKVTTQSMISYSIILMKSNCINPVNLRGDGFWDWYKINTVDMRGETYVRGNGPCKGLEEGPPSSLYAPSAHSALPSGSQFCSVCGPAHHADAPDSADFRNADVSFSGPWMFLHKLTGTKKKHALLYCCESISPVPELPHTSEGKHFISGISRGASFSLNLNMNSWDSCGSQQRAGESRSYDRHWEAHYLHSHSQRVGSSILSHQSVGHLLLNLKAVTVASLHPLHPTRVSVTLGEAAWKQGTGLCHSKTKIAILTLVSEKGHFSGKVPYLLREGNLLPIVRD